MRIVCLSDTHGFHDRLEVPKGDLLVHAGDATLGGDPEEIERFAAWYEALPHPRKVFVAGNHDRLFEDSAEEARGLLGESIVYLQDSEVVVDGLRIWGSPWQPWFLDWSFNLPRGEALREKWAMIPEDTDLLITHGPPQGVLDRVGEAAMVMGRLMGQGPHAGCEELRAAVTRLRPRAHVFGHIHEGYGRVTIDGTQFVNAANVDEAYKPVNAPLVIEL